MTAKWSDHVQLDTPTEPDGGVGCLGCPDTRHPHGDRRTLEQSRSVDAKLDVLLLARALCIAEQKTAPFGHKLGQAGFWGAIVETLADAERVIAGQQPCPEHQGAACLLCSNGGCHACDGLGKIEYDENEAPCDECGGTGSLDMQMARRS